MIPLLIIGAILIVLIACLRKSGKADDAPVRKTERQHHSQQQSRPTPAHHVSDPVVQRVSPPAVQPSKSIEEEKTALEKLIEQKRREGMVPTERYLTTFCFRLEYPDDITETERDRNRQLKEGDRLLVTEKRAEIEIHTTDDVRLGQAPHKYYLDIFRYADRIKSAKVERIINDRDERIVIIEIVMPNDYLPTVMTFTSEDKYTLQRDYPEFDLASILKYEERNPELALQLFREFEAKHHHTENLRGQLYCLRVLKRRDEEIALLEEMLQGQYANWDEFKLRLDTVKKLKSSDMRKAEFDRAHDIERGGQLDEALSIYERLYEESEGPTYALVTRIQSCLHKLGRTEEEKQFIAQALFRNNFTEKAKAELEKKLAKLD